ncbi:MAG TPA: hydrogenase subunit MbhD domain-containing protein [Pedomonas sp.]|uniref:Na(+)/H(+) antiporter subunit B n=1 Tax=Pedomonas sp. TaxID=2976421 RepID=UPI002F405F41
MTENLGLAFDATLAMLLVWASAQATSRDLFRAVVMFIVLGLLASLAWLRLGAPDLAMTEAAVGAGLTGVLLLDTLGRLRWKRQKRGGPQ